MGHILVFHRQKIQLRIGKDMIRQYFYNQHYDDMDSFDTHRDLHISASAHRLVHILKIQFL